MRTSAPTWTSTEAAGIIYRAFRRPSNSTVK